MLTWMRYVPFLLAIAVGSCLLGPSPSALGDEDTPTAGGPVYDNPELGLKARASAGWKVSADKGTVTQWSRLAKFWDPDTTAEAELSQRARKNATLNDLLKSVRADWAKNQEITVTGTRTVEATALNPQSTVIVEGTYIVRPEAKDPAQPPPAPITWRVAATYYLAPGYEYMLYAKAQATHWSRARTAVQDLAKSVRWTQAGARGPKGAGAYRDDRNGFVCRYPTGYTVVAPARDQHLVQFEGVSAEDPVLGVYRFSWDEPLDRDAERLVAYYEEELGGEAEVSSVQVGGKSGQLVSATAKVGGRDQAIYIAIVKRGADDFFRVKASMHKRFAGTGRAAFTRFLDSFKMGPTPK